jgi:hypothetical protein
MVALKSVLFLIATVLALPRPEGETSQNVENAQVAEAELEVETAEAAEAGENGEAFEPGTLGFNPATAAATGFNPLANPAGAAVTGFQPGSQWGGGGAFNPAFPAGGFQHGAQHGVQPGFVGQNWNNYGGEWEGHGGEWEDYDGEWEDYDEY